MEKDGGRAVSSDDASRLVDELAHPDRSVRLAASHSLSSLVLQTARMPAGGKPEALLSPDERNWTPSQPGAAERAQTRALVSMSRDARRELAAQVLRSARSLPVERLASVIVRRHRPDPDAVRSAVRDLGAEIMATNAIDVIGVGELFGFFRLLATSRGRARSPVQQLLEWIGSRFGSAALVRGLRGVLMDGRAGDRLAALALIEGAELAAGSASPPFIEDRAWAPSRASGAGRSAPTVGMPIYKGPRPPSKAPDVASTERPWPATPELETTSAGRRINVWIGDRAAPRYRIDAGTSAVVHFAVGLPVASSLATGADAAVHDGEIPPAGLTTHWTVVPRLASLAAVEEGCGATIAESGAAVFDLHIPRAGDSASVAIGVTSASQDASLTVLIDVGDKRWRELEIALVRTGVPGRDITDVPLADVRLATSHEWTTPPGEIGLTVILPGLALVTGNVGGQRVNPGDMVDMVTEKTALSGPVDDLRKAVDDFRKVGRWTAYLNDIDAAQLRDRLAAFRPQYDWSSLDDLADQPQRDTWTAASASGDLHDLAFYGRRLYDTLFRPGNPARALLDGLAPGHRINIVWRPGSAAGWVRIPWDLLYRGDVSPGVPVEATSFWGLRFRVACTSHEPTGTASARLGAPTEASCTSLLFFGESPKEPATAESVWQRAMWTSLGAVAKPVVVPQPGGATSSKQQLVQALIEPERTFGAEPMPVAVLYLFCHYGADNAGKAILRFGLDSADANHVIRETELGTSVIASRPLVFANACATAGTGVYEASKLAKSFFDRGCRAYIGSECMVPVAMASRFAMVFFHFLLREVDPGREPISCGEALAQSRLFLWCHYRNIGGLLYAYLNQYDLYLASSREIDALRLG